VPLARRAGRLHVAAGGPAGGRIRAASSRSPSPSRPSLGGLTSPPARFLLNPLFRILAAARAREVMTAAALLVVLGAALRHRSSGGLSMAMGAFLAGVAALRVDLPPPARGRCRAVPRPPPRPLLPRRRHGAGPRRGRRRLAADPQPRCSRSWRSRPCRHLRRRAASSAQFARRSAATAPLLMAQGGEFAFVLYAVGRERQASSTPTVTAEPECRGRRAVDGAHPACSSSCCAAGTHARDAVAWRAIEEADGPRAASALVIGFGRFGQVASQALLARGCRRDHHRRRHRHDPQPPSTFGFKIYYGDGTRLDVLRGGGRAAPRRPSLVCINDKEEPTEPHRRDSSVHEFPAGAACWRAPSTASIRFALVAAGRRLPDPRDLRIRDASSARPRWSPSASRPTRPSRPSPGSAAETRNASPSRWRRASMPAAT
jgi:hypothetical protein